MKTKFLSIRKKTMGLIVILAVVFGLSNLVPTSCFAQCVGSSNMPPTAQNCSCSGGSCTSAQYSLNGYPICVSAASGLQQCTSGSIFIGNTFACTSSMNWTQYLWCCALGGTCGALCALTCEVPPVCIACLAACVAGIGASCTGCAIVNCDLANTGTPVYVISGSPSGNTCPVPA